MTIAICGKYGFIYDRTITDCPDCRNYNITLAQGRARIILVHRSRDMRVTRQIKDIFTRRHCRNKIDAARIIIINRCMYTIRHAVANNSCSKRIKRLICRKIPF